MKLVSIVILNWNGKEFLQRFLPALIRHSDLPGVEIIIADNGSSDDSVIFLEKEYPGLKVIRLEKNYGFSGGYNRAFQETDSKYFLLLNSDIEVTAGWLPPLLNYMEEEENAAACTPKILDFNNRRKFEYAGAGGGFIDRYGYPFCRGRIFDYLEEDRGQYNDPVDIFWGSGACLLIRSDLYREAGGLDDQFFAHMEEIDLCWRLKKMGFKIRSLPSSTVYHVGGGTLARGNPVKTFLNFRNNLLLIYKNLPRRERKRTLFIRMLMDGISGLRFLLQGSLKDFLAVFRAHLAYYRLRGSYSSSDGQNNIPENSVIVTEIYPGSIVAAFFLKGKKRFEQLEQAFRVEG